MAANEATDAGLTTTTSAIVVVRASGDDPIAPSGGKDDDDDDGGGIDDVPARGGGGCDDGRFGWIDREEGGVIEEVEGAWDRPASDFVRRVACDSCPPFVKDCVINKPKAIVYLALTYVS